MRQVGDTLVWLALVVTVAAVVYFTPRVANYVSSSEKDALRDGRRGVAWRVAPDWAEESVEEVR
jgi:hypothetical protein